MKNLQECAGMKYACKIHGVECEGKITVQGGTVYLCQNEKDGDRCEDTKGYRHSWSVYTGDADGLRMNNVTEFHLIALDPATYKDWQVGDKMTRGDREGEVIFRSGELVVYKNDGASSNFTCDELYDKGWRLVSEPAESEMAELTLEQVAALAGVDVKTLRIKDK